MKYKGSEVKKIIRKGYPVALLEQIRTLDKRRLKEKLTCLEKTKMQEINRAILISLGF